MKTILAFSASHPQLKSIAAMLLGGMSLVILLISFHLNFQQHAASVILSGAF